MLLITKIYTTTTIANMLLVFMLLLIVLHLTHCFIFLHYFTVPICLVSYSPNYLCIEMLCALVCFLVVGFCFFTTGFLLQKNLSFCNFVCKSFCLTSHNCTCLPMPILIIALSFLSTAKLHSLLPHFIVNV